MGYNNMMSERGGRRRRRKIIIILYFFCTYKRKSQKAKRLLLALKFRPKRNVVPCEIVAALKCFRFVSDQRFCIKFK